jgi:predicted ABC-type ATPase
VPRIDVLRRFKRGLENFAALYQPLADSWELYDNSGAMARNTARMYGTPVYLEKNGKIVAEKRKPGSSPSTLSY